MGHVKHAEPIQKTINRSLHATLEMQRWPKDRSDDQGGWTYVDDDGTKDSDLSVTGWQLMFLRSARNAGFDVPIAGHILANQTALGGWPKNVVKPCYCSLPSAHTIVSEVSLR